MKRLAAKFAKSIGILSVSVIAGMILVVLSFCIPTEKMYSHVRDSVSEMQWGELIPGYPSTQQDSFTDALMLINVMYEKDNSSIIDRAMNVYHFYFVNDNGDLSPNDSLYEWANNGFSNMEYNVYEYARYWHGYLIILKPLLCIFDYSDIRMLNILFQLTLVIVFIYVLVRKKLFGFALPFLLTYFVINPIAISLTLTYSDIFYISIISMIVIALEYEKIKVNDCFYIVFLAIGIATSYFDYLTYPLLTFALPFLLYIYADKEILTRKIYFDSVLNALSWCLGYGGMWLAKWIVGSLFTEQNIIKTTWGVFKTRTSLDVVGTKISIIDVYKANLRVITSPIFLLLFGSVFLILFVTILYKYIKKEITISKNDVTAIIIFIIISICQFVWYAFASNHSYVHSWMTYRELAISICSIATALMYILGKGKRA